MAGIADKIFHGGDIITVDEADTITEALAIKGNTIIAVGKYDDVIKTRGDVTELVDLAGKTLMPGFIEPHSHPFAKTLFQTNFEDPQGMNYISFKDILQELNKMIAKKPAGEWIMMCGFNPILMYDTDCTLTRDMLDEISSEHPILVLHKTCHVGYANSRALELAGVDEDTPPPTEGEYVKDQNGRLNGIIKEVPGIRRFLAVAPKHSEELVKRNMMAVLQGYAKVGVTSVAELALGASGLTKPPFNEFFSLGNHSDCPVRLIAYVIEPLCAGVPSEAFRKHTPDTCAYINGAKYFSDGTPLSNTMALREPYLNSDLSRKANEKKYPNYGLLNHAFENMMDALRPIHVQGLQIAVHVQGERGVDQILDVFEALLRETPRVDHRHRLEHAALVTDSQLRRAHSLGVTVSFIVDHVYYYSHGLSTGLIGRERTNRLCPLSTATKLGIKWSLHSDSPILPTNPLRTLRTATTRLSRNAGPSREEVFGQDETVTLTEAIRGVTINAAWQCFIEHLVGSLEVGKLADLVILEKNPYDVPLAELDSINIHGTYKNGRKVVTSG